jgi:hypothetical protein
MAASRMDWRGCLSLNKLSFASHLQLDKSMPGFYEDFNQRIAEELQLTV